MSVINAEPPVLQSPDALVQLGIERLQQQYPNFAPNPGDPNYELFIAYAFLVAEAIVLSFNVPEEIVKFVGEVVYQTPPIAATYASASSTWIANDALGHEIEAGTQIDVINASGERVGFEVAETVVIPTGSAATGSGTVGLRAIEAGSDSNVVGSFTVEPVEPLSWLKEVTLTSAPANGSDEETTEEYTKRIRELARLMKPQPILPEDFANLVRLIVPGLKGARVLAVDLLQMQNAYGHANTTSLGSGVERCVTVIPVLADGTEPTEAVQKEAYEAITARREASFKAYVGSPTYNSINVTVVGTYLPGYNQAGTEAEVKLALEELLAARNWGLPPGETPGGWVNRKTLRYQDVVTAVNNVKGFGHYTTLTVNAGTADVALTGIAPLTQAGTLSVTLTAGTE
jgi:hypothetical protein